jgi:tetratricopeptide (TPR) repeat protein
MSAKNKNLMDTKKVPNFGWLIIIGPVIIIAGAMIFESSSFIADIGIRSAVSEARDLCSWGRTLMKQEQYREAIVQFNAARKIAPDLVDAVVNLGIAYHLAGEDDKALACLNKAITLNPRDKGVIYNNLGLIHEKRGNIDLAIDNYNKAVELGIDQEKTWRNIAILESEQEKWKEAIEAYKKAIDNRPTLQNLYVQALKKELIAEGNEEYIADINARLERGALEEDLAPYCTEIADYFLNNNSNLAGDYINLAQAYEANGQIGESIASLSLAVKIQPDRVALYNRMGLLYARQGLVDEAERAFKACLKVDPDNAGALKGVNELCPSLRGGKD